VRLCSQLFSIAFATLFTAALESRLLAAQGTTTASIDGTVTDDSGRGIESAQVQVINRITGVVTSSVTRDAGRYLVQGLEVGGPNAVVVRRIGFATETKENVFLSLGQDLRLDFRLEPEAAVLSPVVVHGNPDPAFSSARTGVATIVSDSALRRLPTPNRDLYGFVVLAPQVSTANGLSGGGVNQRFNNFLIDGASELGVYGRLNGAVYGAKAISIEAVKEYQIVLSPYGVSLGDFAGTLINAVTKSGTNDLHGTAFFYARSDLLAGNGSFQGPPSYQSQAGFSLGGPIIRDRVHFFIASEFQQRTTPANGPYVGQGASSQTPLPADTADIARFAQILAAKGLQAGTGGLVDTHDPARNFFARVDVALPSAGSRLILRYNYTRADSGALSRPETPVATMCFTQSCFPLSSVERHQLAVKHVAVAQLYTYFRDGADNELTLGYRTQPLRITPDVNQPLIQVTVPNPSVPANPTILQAGAIEFAQGNLTDQVVYDVADDFTFPIGAHRMSVGTKVELYRLRLLQLKGSYGTWAFSSLNSLQHDSAQSYSVATNLGGADATMRGVQVAVYAGDQWQVSPRWSLTYGLRLDLPILINRPPYDTTVDVAFGQRTDAVPTGHPQWSPRVGFNWDVTGDQRNQIRGGAGVFVGRPPLAWLLSAYANFGKGLGVLTCTGNPPPFDPAYANPPLACASGSGSRSKPVVTFLDPDLKFPETLRASLAYDRRLPWGLVATVEGLYTRNLDDFFYVNRNLAGPIGVDPHGRAMYGTFNSSGVATPTLISPVLFSNKVIEVTNQSRNYSYSLTGQLQKRFSHSLEASAAFNYSRVRDVQTLQAVAAYDNWQSGRAVAGDERKENLGVSGYDQPQRVVFSATYTFPWPSWSTDVSLVYIGEAGLPYTYFANGNPLTGDLNADGTNQNDAIYIPKSTSDTLEIRFSPTAVPVATQQAAFDKFLRDTPCVNVQRGRIMERNSCRSPWRNTTNLSVRQSLPVRHGHALTLQVDIFNFLNLVNKNWGLLKIPNTALLTQVAATAAQQPIFSFNPRFLPYSSQNLYSYYQIEVAARYSF
jgi:hypothetical protein